MIYGNRKNKSKKSKHLSQFSPQSHWFGRCLSNINIVCCQANGYQERRHSLRKFVQHTLEKTWRLLWRDCSKQQFWIILSRSFFVLQEVNYFCAAFCWKTLCSLGLLVMRFFHCLLGVQCSLKYGYHQKDVHCEDWEDFMTLWCVSKGIDPKYDTDFIIIIL